MLYPKNGSQVYPLVAAGGALAAQAPVGLGAIADPSVVASGYSTSGLFTRVTTINPGTVSKLPNLGASFSTPLLDLLGAPFTLALGEILQLMIWAEDPAPGPDQVIWAAVHAGPLSATSFGAGVALEAVAGNWRAQHIRNVGAGWLYTNATAVDASTRGAIMQLPIGTDDLQARLNCFPIDSAGIKIGATNAPTSPTTVGAWLETIDTLSWGTGWATGVGGTGGVVGLSARAIAMSRSSVANTGL